jgi:hypothetical protein
MKQQIIDSMRTFAHQRPGLEYGNYGDRTSYQSEMRAITKDLHQARELLRYVELRDSITGDDIITASKNAYSGRLTIAADATIDYCTGQYWPTEYRRAVCAVLASAIWEWKRDHCMPAPTLHHNSETGETLQRYKGLRAGDYLRANLKREFGRGMAARWFS